MKKDLNLQNWTQSMQQKEKMKEPRHVILKFHNIKNKKKVPKMSWEKKSEFTTNEKSIKVSSPIVNAKSYGQINLNLGGLRRK